MAESLDTLVADSEWVLLGTLVLYLRRLGRRSGRRELPPGGE
jgi:hypothetical protein